jgi:hypothetical protein
VIRETHSSGMHSGVASHVVGAVNARPIDDLRSGSPAWSGRLSVRALQLNSS